MNRKCKLNVHCFIPHVAPSLDSERQVLISAQLEVLVICVISACVAVVLQALEFPAPKYKH